MTRQETKPPGFDLINEPQVGEDDNAWSIVPARKVSKDEYFPSTYIEMGMSQLLCII